MEKKKLIASVIVICLGVIGSVFLYNSKNKTNDITDESAAIKNPTENSQTETKDKNSDIKHNSHLKNANKNDVAKDKTVEKTQDSIIKANLYNSGSGDMLPLSAINIMSDLPVDINNKILKIAENGNIFMIQKNKDKLLIITENPSNIRHNIEFTEISTKNGHQINTTLGYNDKFHDSDNDIWEYDDSKQPIRHSKYKSDGDIEFVEVWNYDDSNPVKYEMKDAEGHIISMKKETLDDNVNLRIEHLVYDREGNTKINVSTTYEGEDIKRFTYYNADKPQESGSVFTEYENGLKTKETLYSSDLKLKNSYTSDYRNGEREDITVWDNHNKEVKKLVSETPSSDSL